MAVTGGCRCGEVRYEIALDALPPAYACHCHQCQRWTGSAFSLNAIVPEKTLTVSGPILTFEKVTEDRVSTQRLCGTCHSRIYNTNTRRPGLVIMRAGTLDDSENIECKAHIYTAYRQDWMIVPETTPQWPEAAPMDDFIAALASR